MGSYNHMGLGKCSELCLVLKDLPTLEHLMLRYVGLREFPADRVLMCARSTKTAHCALWEWKEAAERIGGAKKIADCRNSHFKLMGKLGKGE
jgi:hypothetical protein